MTCLQGGSVAVRIVHFTCVLLSRTGGMTGHVIPGARNDKVFIGTETYFLEASAEAQHWNLVVKIAIVGEQTHYWWFHGSLAMAPVPDSTTGSWEYLRPRTGTLACAHYPDPHVAQKPVPSAGETDDDIKHDAITVTTRTSICIAIASSDLTNRLACNIPISHMAHLVDNYMLHAIGALLPSTRSRTCNNIRYTFRLQVELTGAAVLATFWSTLRPVIVAALAECLLPSPSSSRHHSRRRQHTCWGCAGRVPQPSSSGLYWLTQGLTGADPPTAVVVVVTVTGGSMISSASLAEVPGMECDEAGDNTGSKAYEGVGKVTSHAQWKRDESSDSESSVLQQGPVATTTNAVTVVVIADHIHPRRRRLQRR
ncbi:hypothetical protein EDB83DRAFT_2557996 [Lactarius deliciosus]|nr:hypothetical protein EDB83DRAFT_2557996 [Lactarius deliciosus]